MELNTPNKKNQTISTPLSQFEESPVFNYINNLSPIELVKSAHNDHSFSSLSFSSPPSVFASPKLNYQRDNKSFLKRRHFSDLQKSKASQSIGDDNTREGGCAEQVECTTSSNLAREGTVQPLNEQLDSAVELPTVMQCDSANADHSIAPLDAIRSYGDSENINASNERHCSYENEKHLRKICRIESSGDEAGCDWVTLVSNVSDMLDFDPSTSGENLEEQKMVDPGTISFISNVLQIPQDNTNSLENMEPTDCVGFSEEQTGDPETESTELREQEVDRIPSVLSGSLLSKLVDYNAATEMDAKGQKCQSSCKQHSIRRLVFEVAGAHRKKLVCDTDGAPNLPKSDCKISHAENRPSSRLSVLSRKGIGLHLNALANASNDGKVIKIETVSSIRQDIEIVPSDSEDRLEENAPKTSVDVNEDFGTSSPKMKRQKMEHVGSACKRCNCKRSKCLKLYCECFAAGLYCIEPCSCQDCFNKPAHEDKVLETRKQIESRNPLAFAPKVIRNTDFVSEFADETNKTPASARHKRGCNCKKSNCLKKYCECYQGGVGCSANCRCEGCKNTFGTKNGHEENDVEGEECEVVEMITSGKTSEDDIIERVEEEHANLRMSSETTRSSMQLPIAFRGQLLRPFPAIGSSSKISSCQKLGTELFRQSKFGTHLQAIPEEETPEISSSRSESNGVKSSSPNSKRVSPPHRGFGSSSSWGSSRKVILRSVPFPSLNSPNQKG
ncbi:protein tesmin/TSO1-like CXC 2 isoform X2 [Euphorbia lathyris]|uniref:protein tesmin/TSO1-like CXC 2 isoform X2 n=1 Tax=Euphorbia lathyris TaxID=212925 RepID=UPI0033131343